MSTQAIPLIWPPKDADEKLDYAIDWTARLGGDTIFSSTWTIAGAGLTKDSETTQSVRTIVWLSGGVLGRKYLLTNHIVTAGGREMDQTVQIRINSK